MAPLIDMTFLLLIFFLVTTSFVKETGIDVMRSTAATAEVKDRGNVMIGVNAEGDVYIAQDHQASRCSNRSSRSTAALRSSPHLFPPRDAGED
jgi:biopolymer transport protein ExbD